MIAHHSYAAGVPENLALRSAFFWSALIVAVVAIVLLISGNTQALQSPGGPAAAIGEKPSPRHDLVAAGERVGAPTATGTGAKADSSASHSVAIRAAAYFQNKPQGSIFPAPIRIAQ
ncbi:MAG: hypothetical protein H7274_00945 [Rhodoferax sp.]|nr:hypothetical protein [Rhodoferax sp.]